MNRFRVALGAAFLATAGVIAPMLTAPVAAAAVDDTDPARFIDTLSTQAFQVLRTGSRDAARPRFRQLLGQYFAIDEIGDKLARQFQAKMTPAQWSAYRAALPGFLIGTYSNQLYNYANAQVKVLRTVPRGNGAAVLTQVIQPGQSPITAVWEVENVGGHYKVTNLIVSGINLVLTQTADFDSFVQKNGIDKLIAFMRAHGGV